MIKTLGFGWFIEFHTILMGDCGKSLNEIKLSLLFEDQLETMVS